jgi:tetratricopeptide (TPR) repeat protein
MAAFQNEDRARIRRVKAEQAVNLAMQSRWAEAADLNRQIIDTYPKDIEAHNRLGKALMELSQFDEARQMYNHTLRLDPTNGIAQKNLQRLEKLMTETVPDLPSGPVDPSLFIEETGRTTTTTLVQTAPDDVLAKMNPGDSVDLVVQDNVIVARNSAGDVLGRIEPKLRQRLIRLFGMGNQYAAFVTAVDEHSLRVIIRETHRDPSMGSRPSFPTTGDVFRGYVRDSLLRYDLDEEDEDEDEELEEHEPDHEPDLATEDVAVDEVRGAVADDIGDEEDDDEEP